MDDLNQFVTQTFSNEDIIKSPSDNRSYRCLKLTNGMTVMLISDPKTDRSAAALDVHIGNMSDPDELPGLAHFCEHMLFLGTEKYENENEYSKFLNEHGGGSNASTSTEHTTYHFSVGPEHLAGALDRFAQFFLCPLFTESATEREVNAVNSENDKNIKNDMRRLYQLGRMLSNPSHPYRRFGTGNKECLDTTPRELGVDVRGELLKFHSRYYSANIMQLCVLGKESLDELTQLVVPLFHGVENKSVSIPEWPEHPYQQQQLQRQICVVPVKDVRSLTVTWTIPDVSEHYHSKPVNYLSHLLGHEGPGSLLSQLKLEGWSSSLTAGQKNGARGFGFFYVKVDLSEEGLEHTNDIITLVYQYINMLQRAGIQQWIFEEYKKLRAIKFQFKDKEHPTSYVTAVARDNDRYSTGELLSGPYLMTEFNPDVTQMLLDKLTPSNMSVMVVAKKFEGDTDQTEKWYGTQYRVDPYSQQQIKFWGSCGFHDNLYLPEKNEFIPENLDLVPRTEVSPYPIVIKNSDFVRLWYKQDEEFNLPKAFTSFTFYSPIAYTDPGSVCMMSLFSSLMDDALTEYTYSAYLAGLSYSFSHHRHGIEVSVSGYSDKQILLLRKILEKMANFEVDAQRFNIHKEKLERSYKNFKAEQPHYHATYSLSLIMADSFWTKDESLEYLADVTVDKLQAFIQLFRTRLYIEGLVYGNVTQQVAMATIAVVEKVLQDQAGTRPLPASQHPLFREMHLPPDSWYVYRMENSVHPSACVCVYYQVGMQDTHSNMLLELLKQVIGEPAFDTLRTKEQLGYIVWTRVRRSYGAQGLRVLVQSDKPASFVESRIEAFLLSMDTYLKELSDEDFQKHVKALETRRLEKPKKMSSQNSKFLDEIEEKVYHFDRDNVEVTHLKGLSKTQLYSFFKKHISPDASERRKLCVHVVPSATAHQDTPPDSGNSQQNQAVIVEDISQLKKSLSILPSLLPVMDVSKSLL